MSMIGFSFMELLVLVFLGGSPLSLPLSLPPLPEDPALAQVAPQECLWYLTWAGCAKPDPASKNHTEQLLAEQEVQRFISELETRLRDAIKRGAPQGPQAAQAAVLAEEGPNLLKLLITRAFQNATWPGKPWSSPSSSRVCFHNETPGSDPFSARA